ncbi:MAG: hypothetical protein FJ405_06640 [Verrucomicrobia bacterium]|nr:hypothetical protein [Verrucomicrobiota bacterium]
MFPSLGAVWILVDWAMSKRTPDPDWIVALTAFPIECWVASALLGIHGWFLWRARPTPQQDNG